MKLITELTEEVSYLEEATGEGEKSLFIEGPFMQADITNRNGRSYPSRIMDKEVARYVKEQVDTGRALGELGHPSGPTINLERVSHKIVSLRKEGSNYIGKAKIMATPYGDIVKNLMKEGVKLGVSSRGLGSLKLNREGVNEVQDDFHLATAADIVADPSAPAAFVRGIMEGAEWVWDNGIIREASVNQMASTIRKAPKRRLEEASLKVWAQFLGDLSKT